MTSMTLATILQLPFLATPETYAEAHQQTVETGRPLVVMVGADWCPACHQMERDVIPVVRQRGLLRRVAFALVNLDRDRDVGQKLTGGGPIPQLIVFRKTPEGWHRTELIGAQSIEKVEQLIQNELTQQDNNQSDTASKADNDVSKHSSARPPMNNIVVKGMDSAAEAIP